MRLTDELRRWLLLAAVLVLAAVIGLILVREGSSSTPDRNRAAVPARPGHGHVRDVKRREAPDPERQRRRVAAPPRSSTVHPRSIEWRRSIAVGEHAAGELRRGVMLPSEGRSFVSWDPVERDKPNRWWRRWGTDRLLRATLAVTREYAAEHPRAPRILIGDMSRPHGGDFGTDYGPIGHASHQNGLDVDVYYPRLDRREWTPGLPEQVDVERSQELVDAFVAAGAEVVYVGPSLPLSGPEGVVVPLANHDNHLHFRLPTEG